MTINEEDENEILYLIDRFILTAKIYDLNKLQRMIINLKIQENISLKLYRRGEGVLNKNILLLFILELFFQ